MSSQVEYTPQSPKESTPPQQRPANLLSHGKGFLPLEGRIDVTEWTYYVSDPIQSAIHTQSNLNS